MTHRLGALIESVGRGPVVDPPYKPLSPRSSRLPRFAFALFFVHQRMDVNA